MLDKEKDNILRAPRSVAEARFTIELSEPQNEGYLWPTIEEFSSFKTPIFPLDPFPKWFSNYAFSISEFTETPVELSAITILEVVSALVSKVFSVEASSGYVEPLNLWAIVAMEPSNRKTEILKKCVQPIFSWEKEQEDDIKKERDSAVSIRKSMQEIIEHKRRLLRSSKDFETDLKKIEEMESKLPLVPNSPRIIAEDITPEKLGILMKENHEKMAIFSDEGGFIDIIKGRYSNNIPNLDIFLKSYSQSPIRIDRKSDVALSMNNPLLTILLTPQPQVLFELIKNPIFRGRGLSSRFLFLLPASKIGFRTHDKPPVPNAISEIYHREITNLINFTFNCLKNKETYTLKLSISAQKRLVEFKKEIEYLMTSNKPLDEIRDWGGKLPGNVVRIAGNLHIINNLNNWCLEISEKEIEDAINIANVFKEHILMIFNNRFTNHQTIMAERIIHWIKENTLTEFTKNKCHYRFKRSILKSSEIEEILFELENRHYIRRGDIQHNPKSILYLVNPKLY